MDGFIIMCVGPHKGRAENYMRIDATKSLAELSGTDWGAPPPQSTFRLRERHEARRCALKKLDFAGIRLLIEIDFERDADILVSYALARLGGSFRAHDFDGLGLLNAILRNPSYRWSNADGDVALARSACRNWLSFMDDELSMAESMSEQEFLNRSVKLLTLQNELLEGMVEWERRLGGRG